MLGVAFADSFAILFGWGDSIVICGGWAGINGGDSGKGLIIVGSANVVLSCFGNFKFVSLFAFYLCPLVFLLDPPTPSFLFRIGGIAAHIG